MSFPSYYYGSPMNQIFTNQHYTVQELARRCDTLIRLVEKENEEVEAAEREERKKSTKKTSASRVTDSSGGGAGGSTKVSLAGAICKK